MKLSNLFEQEIDYRKTDLAQLYIKMNMQYFGGELPLVKTKWTSSTRHGGMVKALRNRKTNEITIAHLEISNHTLMTEERLKGLMAHEMIHVYILGVLGINEKEKGGHGRLFMKKFREMQAITPFEIPLTDNITDADIASHIKGKPTVIVDIKDRGYMAMTVKMYKANEDRVQRFLNNFAPNYSIYISDSNVISKMTVKRAFSGKFGIHPLNKDDGSKIQNSIKELLLVVKDGKIAGKRT